MTFMSVSSGNDGVERSRTALRVQAGWPARPLGWRISYDMRTIFVATIILMFVAKPGDVSAQSALTYDPSGYLTTASNIVTALPLTFQFTPQYLAAESGGLLSASAPVSSTGKFACQRLFSGFPISGATESIQHV